MRALAPPEDTVDTDQLCAPLADGQKASAVNGPENVLLKQVIERRSTKLGHAPEEKAGAA